MQTVLIVIHLMVVIALVGVVLLQRSEGGALGIGGGGGFMSGRGQANVLTRATAILAALFFATSLGLTLLANFTRAPKSILQGVTPPASSSSAPAKPASGNSNLLEQLKKLEQQRQAAPAVPAVPAAPQAPNSK
jgi:preprotein translocase subunit SecG